MKPVCRVVTLSVQPRWLFFACLAATWCLYVRSLGGPLILDDFATIQPFLRMRSLPPDWPALAMSPTGPLGRPLSMLSFLANVRWGNSGIWGWKAVNLALHLSVGYLLFLVALRVFGSSEVTPTPAVAWKAFFVATLWLIHPSHPSTVLYTVQRMTELSALFTVAGILCHLHARTRVEGSTSVDILLLAPYLIFLPLAALSKETGLLLPGYLCALELTVLRGHGTPLNRRRARGLLWGLAFVPLAAAAIYTIFNFEALILRPLEGHGYSISGRLLTESRVLLRYFVQTIVPQKSKFGFFHDDLALSTELTSPPETLLGMALLLTLLVGGLLLRRRAPVVALGIGWFLVGHSMESTILPLEIMFEHRNYLPSFGLLMALTSALSTRRSEPGGFWWPSIAGITILFFSYVTWTMVDDWKSEMSLYPALYTAHRHSPTAASQMAELLTASHFFSEARSVLAPIPGSGAEIHRWFLTCRQYGELPASDLNPAVLDGERILSAYAATGLVELTKLFLDGQCRLSSERLRDFIENALRHPFLIESHRQTALVYLAHVDFRKGQTDLAYEDLRKAYQVDPRDPLPLFLTTEWKIERHDLEDAQAAFVVACKVAATSGRDYSAMIEALREMLAAEKH